MRVSEFTVDLREPTPVGAFTARIVKGPIPRAITLRARGLMKILNIA